MAFCITFGTHTFNNQLQGYEGVTAQCQNCGNWAAHCITSWEWVTICFVPVIPLSFHKYQEVACPICNFRQDIRNRPDVQSQQGQGGRPPPQQGMMGGPGSGPQQGQYNQPPQGWGQQPNGQQHPMQYK